VKYYLCFLNAWIYGYPCLQTGRAGFVIHPEKGLTQCLNGCLGQWFFSQITASVANTWVIGPYMLPCEDKLLQLCDSKPPYSMDLLLSGLTVIHCGLSSTYWSAVTVNQVTLSPERLNAQRRHAWVMIPLPKPHIKPQLVRHCTHDEIIQALSPFCTVCDKKLGRSLGMRLIVTMNTNMSSH